MLVVHRSLIVAKGSVNQANPDLCLNTSSMVTLPFPFSAKAGQYLETRSLGKAAISVMVANLRSKVLFTGHDFY